MTPDSASDPTEPQNLAKGPTAINTAFARVGQVVVQDVEDFDQAFDAQSASELGKAPTEEKDKAPPRKRGRPAESQTLTTFTAEGALKSLDFYFLRAILENIDPKEAAERYLAQERSLDKRAAEEYAHKLRRRMQRLISMHRERDEGWLYLKELNTPTETAVFGLSLEEFAQRFDEDMYSEAELIELYQEEYGAQPGGSSVQPEIALKTKLRALEWLRERLAIDPSANKLVEEWIERRIAHRVRDFGVLTLGEFADWINLTGRRWYEHIPGVGRTRSKRIMEFFHQNEQWIGKPLSKRLGVSLGEKYKLPQAVSGTFISTQKSLETPKKTELARVDAIEVYGIVPLESFIWPQALLGMDGMFRSQRPNTYKAVNDREAIEAWFNTLNEKAPATRDSYRRAIERLVLWAIVERGVALSSLDTNDIIAFREFLRNPPAHWCNHFPVMRYSSDWRPLRGSLGDAAVQQVMSAVASMFSDWVMSNYLSANAVGSVRSSKKKELRMDVMRSFADEDLAVIRSTLEKMKDGPSKRRLRAIILLYQTSGLRRSEGGQLTWGMLEPVRLDNRISTHWAVTFTGKGNKERKVPIQLVVVEALQAHFDDRQALVVSGKLPYSQVAKTDSPLLSILDERLSKEQKAGVGDGPHAAARSGNKTGALSDGRIHGILKAFFKQVSMQPGLVQGQANFLKASTHWLRHTFAHQALAGSNRDLPAVQQILGHADIGTTGIYVKADMAARVAAVDSVKAAV